MTLLEEIGKAAPHGDLDFLRTAVKVVAEALMELEVAAKLGAERYEGTTERTGYRNGYRTRTWNTRAGTVELAIPKLRSGSASRRAPRCNGRTRARDVMRRWGRISTS